MEGTTSRRGSLGVEGFGEGGDQQSVMGRRGSGMDGRRVGMEG
jgi:hypothetical protein